ncbi:MAG: zinc-binding dehydrogenase [Erysipelotrichaceae bacterium]
MNKNMRVGVLTSPGEFAIKKHELKALGKNDVLVKQKTCNICTTDYTQYKGLRNHQGFPMAGGHEGAGEIVQVGGNVSALQVGDHVTVMCNACNMCSECQEGHEGLCEKNDLTSTTNEYGYYGSMGFADYIILPASRVLKINKSIPFAQAGFLEPLATVVKGQKLLGVKAGETVVVIGGGTMGLLNALFYRSIACKVIVSELMDNKINNCIEQGFEVIDAKKEDPVKEVKRLTNNKGADAVIVAVGNSKANDQAIKMLKPNYGKLSFFAASHPEPLNTFSSNLIHYKRMKIIGTTGADYSDFLDAAKLMNTCIYDFSCILEKKQFTLDEIKEGFEYASTLGKYRVTINL